MDWDVTLKTLNLRLILLTLRGDTSGPCSVGIGGGHLTPPDISGLESRIDLIL